MGISLKDIRNHLLNKFPELKEVGIQRDAIHFLMAPPWKNSSHSCRYKGLVNAKVPAKTNCYGEDSTNQHFLFARVAYLKEFVAKFKEECCMYSCDDMN